MFKCMIASEITVKYCHLPYNLVINKYLSYISIYGHCFSFVSLYVHLLLLCHAFILFKLTITESSYQVKIACVIFLCGLIGADEKVV